MQPSLRITPAPFADDVALAAVMAALGAGQARLVGGCVRNAVLGEDRGDIDIATTLTPDAVMATLGQAGIRTVPTGLEHGTVTAVVDGRGFEVTTLRRDVETDGRRAVVAFTQDWIEDAQRRDFTMNTLLMDMDGAVYDPTGQGVEDLRAGRVRFVGDAATRIAEDALRILRFFRFFARYGKGEPDAEGYAACTSGASLIENLSRERVTHEVERLLLEPRSGDALAAMISGNILTGLLRLDFNNKVYDGLRDFTLRHADAVSFMILFAYSVWENDPEKIDAKIAEYIIFSNRKRSILNQCIQFCHEQHDSIRKNLFHYGKEIASSGTVLYKSINAKAFEADECALLLKGIAEIPVPQFSLKAADVMRATGIGHGVMLGKVLRKVEAWWLENDTIPDHAACFDYAKKLDLTTL